MMMEDKMNRNYRSFVERDNVPKIGILKNITEMKQALKSVPGVEEYWAAEGESRLRQGGGGCYVVRSAHGGLKVIEKRW